jgi:putative transposase
MYLLLLKRYTSQYKVDILGYCLLTNHVHLIAIPAVAAGLAKALGRTHNDYARWLNIRRSESGHLWQNRFFSCPLDARHTWAALAYVERNAVKAGLAARAADWAWSSARRHLGLQQTPDWLHTELWSQTWGPSRWRTVLDEGMAEAELQDRLREATKTGRPLGDASFTEACEARFGIRVRRQKPGPKAKALAACAPST